MTAAELVTLGERLTALAAYFDRPLNETQSEIYLAGLEDLSLEAVIHAITEWVKHGRPFMPKVVELRDLADPEGLWRRRIGAYDRDRVSRLCRVV